MSKITDVIIIDSSDSIRTKNDISRFDEIFPGFKFTCISNPNILDQIAGNKVFTGEAYLFSYNYFPIEKFLDFLSNKVFWEDKKEVIILIKEEKLLRFSIFSL